MKKTRGFTLIELVLVITIMLILFSVSGINYKVTDRMEAKNQIYELKYNINEIKRYSQIHRYKGSIEIKDDGYVINFKDKSEEIKFNKLVNFESTNLSVISFTSKGKPSFKNNVNSAGTIVYTIGNKQYKITIEPVTGKVNLRIMGEN